MADLRGRHTVGFERWIARLRKVGRLAAIVAVAAFLILILWRVPIEQVASLRAVKGINPKDIFKAENDARATLAQIIGGFAVLVGLVFAWNNISETAKTLELAREGQITERFTKAIDQLGAADNDGESRLAVRLGGIYALERIARDSKKDHWPIMEILTAYVRAHPATAPDVSDKSPDNLEEQLPKDIQAILTVIGRRAQTYLNGEDQRLDLGNAHLEGAKLEGAHLEGARFARPHLERAYLFGAHLEGSELFGAHLDNANLQANLEGANLDSAHLEGANLFNASLKWAILRGAHLKGANLSSAHLEGAYLEGADLNGALLVVAHLEGAHLVAADLNGADLYGANLSGAVGLTQQQVDSARGNQRAVLPPGIIRPKSWNSP